MSLYIDVLLTHDTGTFTKGTGRWKMERCKAKTLRTRKERCHKGFHEIERRELAREDCTITEVTYSGARGKLYYFRKKTEPDSNPDLNPTAADLSW